MSEAMTRGEEIVYAQHLRNVERERDASDYPKRVKPDVPVELFSWPEYRELAAAIEAALAASEQRVTEDMCPPGWHRIVCDQLQIDALTTERDDLRAKLQASERLVRAARTVVKHYPWHPGNSDQRREFYYSVEELQVSLSDYDCALAPPREPEDK